MGSGFTQKVIKILNEAELPLTVEVFYGGLSSGGRLRFPRLKEIRYDIDPGDQEAINIKQFVGIPVTT